MKFCKMGKHKMEDKQMDLNPNKLGSITRFYYKCKKCPLEFTFSIMPAHGSWDELSIHAFIEIMLELEGKK